VLVDCCYHEIRNLTYARTLEPGRQGQAIEVLDVDNGLFELALLDGAYSTSRHDRVVSFLMGYWNLGWRGVIGLAESDARLVCCDKKTPEWSCVTTGSGWLGQIRWTG
jgi:hypothetical protein